MFDDSKACRAVSEGTLAGNRALYKLGEVGGFSLEGLSHACPFALTQDFCVLRRRFSSEFFVESLEASESSSPITSVSVHFFNIGRRRTTCNYWLASKNILLTV
eukprot:TRINITY_DN3134_c0_g1_i1.p1 TRINITY_DN3134_c0_g1~~TRINITY_DN3134_c0_g1_i1.p1  ORF type:complete len:104 (-),score=13.05 TRINITY_DN3134_c0_g1_i1:45-356(-)